jgi:adenosylhomocysteine nucleosidase
VRIVRILITFAVEAEFAPWRKLRNFELIQRGLLTLHRAQIGQATVDFIVTGMGPENARRASEAAMAAPYTICIASGFAGALKAKHRVGHVLVARAVRQLGKSQTIECSRKLCVPEFKDGAGPANMFLTTDKLVGTAAEKKQLSPLADAVDMESFAVLSVAKEHDLPAVAIRVITDRLDEDMPADIVTTVNDKGRVRVAGLLRYVASHPLQLPAMIRLGRKSRIAAEALANFLQAYIKNLSLSRNDEPPVELMEIAAT